MHSKSGSSNPGNRGFHHEEQEGHEGNGFNKGCPSDPTYCAGANVFPSELVRVIVITFRSDFGTPSESIRV